MSGWLKLHSLTPQHPKVSRLATPAARWAFVVYLCNAKERNDPRWDSRQHVRMCVGDQSRYLDELVRVGLLEPDGDGWRIHDWHDYQVDPTGAERKRKERQSQSSHGPVTVQSRSSHEDVTVLSRRETETETETETYALAGVPGAPPDGWHELCLHVEQLTGLAFALGSWHGGYGAKAADLLERHGPAAVTAAFSAVAGATTTKPSVRMLVFGAEEYLDRVPKLKAIEAVAEPGPKSEAEFLELQATKRRRDPLLEEIAAAMASRAEA